MSTSEEYLRDLVRAEETMDWGAAVREAIEMFGKGATKFLSGATESNQRSAERWVAKATDKINPKTGEPSQSSTPGPMHQVQIVDSIKRAKAAEKLRASRVAHVGDVDVAYMDTGLDEGQRKIGNLPVARTLATAVEAAADALKSGDYELAAELLDNGVLDAYGVPEGTLAITDYQGGITFD